MFMIAGPNGAGKSTLYETRIKPHTAAPFINADIIQRDELKDPSMSASYKAAEIAEARRREHLKEGKDFVSESTFSHPSKLELIRDAKEAGFRVVVYHVNVRSPDLSVHRVAARVQEGGHNVPETNIRDRYERNQPLIRDAVRHADRGYVYDNSKLNVAPSLVIRFKDGQVTKVADNVPAWARELYRDDLAHISPSRLNPAAASFAEAKAIAEKVGGKDAQLKVADTRQARSYTGTIVGESSLHWLQQDKDGGFTAHFKSAIQRGDVELSYRYKIDYSAPGVAMAMPVPTERHKLAAEAFRRDGDRQEALKAYPELSTAYAALDLVTAKASAMPQVARDKALARAKAQIAADIEAPKSQHQAQREAEPRGPKKDLDR